MLYIFLSLLAAIGFSISDICSKYLLNKGVSNLQFLFWAHGIAFILLTLLFMLIGKNLSLKFLTNGDNYSKLLSYPKGNLGWVLILCSLASFFGLVALIYAFKISDNIGYTSAIVGTVTMITFLLSWIVFDKKPELKGLFGAALILFGVYLISTCKN
jgi:drug/metabolite transporter (DMT)-like permease